MAKPQAHIVGYQFGEHSVTVRMRRGKPQFRIMRLLTDNEIHGPTYQESEWFNPYLMQRFLENWHSERRRGFPHEQEPESRIAVKKGTYIFRRQIDTPYGRRYVIAEYNSNRRLMQVHEEGSTHRFPTMTAGLARLIRNAMDHHRIQLAQLNRSR